MRILVTGATGYIGSAVARALLDGGHDVLGLARSEGATTSLRDAAIEPVSGDFTDLERLTDTVKASRPDAVISAASTGASTGDNAVTFARDREAIRAIQAGLDRGGQALLFTSGSAVFGIYRAGARDTTIHEEDHPLPLPASTAMPALPGAHPLLSAGLAASMAARVQTERATLESEHTRGIVLRPGLVYGRGGSYDIPALIVRASARGRAGHVGDGETTQSYVHIDDLAQLYALAVEKAPPGAILHGVVDEVSQRDLAYATNHLLGLGEATDRLSLNEMLGISRGERAGLALTRHLPATIARKLGTAMKAPPSVGTGISLSLNKRLASAKTRTLLNWQPHNTPILEDIESGSYATNRKAQLDRG
jgi:nucleoside-diphosphate-sugar epimerase